MQIGVKEIGPIFSPIINSLWYVGVTIREIVDQNYKWKL